MGEDYGYSYLCTCGTRLFTEHGLDYAEQLMFLKERVDSHRLDHQLAQQKANVL